MGDLYAKTSVRQREASVELVKAVAESDPETQEDGRTWCRFCHTDMPHEGHQLDCVWIMANEIVNPPKKPVDQPRQDVHDFLVQLQTYRNYPDPITMTLHTLTHNLGAQTCERIEQAVMKRLLEVHPGDVFKEGK